MERADEYRLSEYQDLGYLDEKGKAGLRRNRLDGSICVEKKVALDCAPVYEYLKEHTCEYIPEVRECIRNGSLLVVIEEYIAGRTLEQVLMERDMPEDEVTGVALDLCSALSFLHGADPPIICRDLKADNVMLDNEGRIKLVDFDIARVYQEGKRRDTVLLGTEGYAAPEQFGYRQTDQRTDIYALGVLINYMATRHFPSERLADGALGRVVEKCTRLDPDQRYVSAAKLAGELARLRRKASVRRVLPGNEYRRGGGTGTVYRSCRTGAVYHWSCGQAARRQEQGISYGLKEYLPPGFRSRRLWKMVTATLGYAMLLKGSFSLEFSSGDVPLTGIHLWFEQATFFIAQLVVAGIIFDYRGWRGRLPLTGSRYRAVRLVGYVITEFVCLFLWALVCAVVRWLVPC